MSFRGTMPAHSGGLSGSTVPCGNKYDKANNYHDDGDGDCHCNDVNEDKHKGAFSPNMRKTKLFR